MVGQTTGITIRETRLVILRGDITVQDVDAIVNAANSSLMGGGGVDGVIHRAGGPAIVAECKKSLLVLPEHRLPPGQAVITTGGNLKARYVIHTVGPVWHGGNRGETETLASCYRESLKLTAAHHIARLAFPAISTGVCGYPLEKASRVALAAIITYLKTEPVTLKEVRLVLFNETA
jgi:O-acetyl-ADP-ribose deacetylase (regulator of RNase III)